MTTAPNIQYPDVIFVGPLKTATSYIYDYFLQHPNVTTSTPLIEVFYYDEHFEKGSAWYLNHFKPEKDHQVVIDVAPSYMVHENAIENLKQENPNAKIVFTLREPIERFHSHVKHHVRHGNSFKGFNALLEEHPRVVQNSSYVDFIAQWTKAFGEKNIYIFDYQQLRHDPKAFTNELCGLLNVPFNEDFEFDKKVNKAGAARSAVLVRAVHKVMRFMIKHGLDKPIAWVKKTGIKQLLFKNESNFKLPEEDMAMAKAYFSQDIQWYQQRFDCTDNLSNQA